MFHVIILEVRIDGFITQVVFIDKKVENPWHRGNEYRIETLNRVPHREAEYREENLSTAEKTWAEYRIQNLGRVKHRKYKQVFS
ncbi:hypothetical protein E2C01_030992 [Portunus trituberculatus]|uniref:Uncharacterized protein n=1 Tax=Portunus trituberculatus TaxID=210409 RepID=A0A5B7ESG6_PORTR|nr:hypothetical protein [Portunus trituberculatus]